MKKNPVYAISHFRQTFRTSDLYVNTFSKHLENHSFVEKPHRHNFYLLVLFTNGSGTHDIDFDRFEIAPGSLFLLQPGQIHNWSLSQDIEGYIIFCSAEFYNRYFENKQIGDYPFFQSVKNNPHLLLSTPEISELDPYFKLMLAENENHQIRRGEKLLNLLDVLLIEISRKYTTVSDHAAPAYNHKIREFETLLEHHFKTEKSPSFYAAKMSITLKHLNRICKNMLGETVTEIISSRVILEAKRLLANDKLSIAQVADALGFENYPYFGKLFKKQTAMTPGEFRSKIQ
jgi:AraC family transcriptional activator of pobA